MENNRVISKRFMATRFACSLVLLALTLLFGCASSEPKVLQPVESITSKELPSSVTYQKLVAELLALGYEAVGLQHESDSVLELLLNVFSDEAMKGRKIRSIYTGILMGYEPKHETLTVGGMQDPEEIKEYIKKNVPLR